MLESDADVASATNLVLRLTPDDVPLRGQVLGPQGRPIARARVRLVALGTPREAENDARRARPANDESAPRRFRSGGLHADRGRRITFLQENRKLVGFLLARGDGQTPYTVRMRPWAARRGRIVDDKRRLMEVVDAGGGLRQPSLQTEPRWEIAVHDDAGAGVFPFVEIDDDRRFFVGRLVPGQRYRAVVSRGAGQYLGVAFEDIVLDPGEVRDLGDLPIRPLVNAPAR